MTVTDTEMSCARAVCCDGNPCKRGAEHCDAADYVRFVRLVIKDLRGPNHRLIDKAREGLPFASGDAARLINAYLEAVSP